MPSPVKRRTHEFLFWLLRWRWGYTGRARWAAWQQQQAAGGVELNLNAGWERRGYVCKLGSVAPLAAINQGRHWLVFSLRGFGFYPRLICIKFPAAAASDLAEREPMEEEERTFIMVDSLSTYSARVLHQQLAVQPPLAPQTLCLLFATL